MDAGNSFAVASGSGVENMESFRLSNEMLDKMTKVSTSLCSVSDDSTGELNDKEIAARAVAIVVGSARNGLVPLCASVACVLKEKAQLERKIASVQKQLNLYTLQEFDPGQSPGGVTATSTRQTGRDKRPKSFSRRCQMILNRTYNFDRKKPESPSRNQNQTDATKGVVLVTEALVHRSQDGDVAAATATTGALSPTSRRTSTKRSTSVSSGDDVFENLLRVDLPRNRKISAAAKRKLTSEASTSTEKMAEIVTTNAGTNTDDDWDAHTCRESNHWREKFEKSRISERNLEDNLKRLAKTLAELQQSISKDVPKPPRDDVLKRSVQCNTDDAWPPASPESPSTHDQQQQQVLSWMKFSKKQLRGPVFAPCPLFGCKCRKCEVVLNSEYASVKENATVFRISHNGKPLLQIDDHVMIPGHRVGVVCYIGHLDGTETPAAVFVGIKLGKPEGSCDGLHNNKHYFYAPPKHGLFLPINNILFIVNRVATLHKEPQMTKTSKTIYTKHKPKTFGRLRSFSAAAISFS